MGSPYKGFYNEAQRAQHYEFIDLFVKSPKYIIDKFEIMASRENLYIEDKIRYLKILLSELPKFQRIILGLED